MKGFFALAVGFVSALAVNAQKTTTFHYEETQTRALDVVSTGYVKPLVVDLKVDEAKGRQHFSYELGKEFVENDMKGDVQNIHSYGLFRASVDANCDVIVAPTFHLYTNDKGGYTLEIIGYIGVFANWKPMSENDMNWIGLSKTRTTGDRNNVEANLKPGR